MRHFTFKSLEELRRAAQELGAAHVQFEDDPAKVRAALARPVRFGRREIGNSLAVQPMEGCDGTLDGRPDELTWRRYERFARGGAKLIWFEATAVANEGRANTRQLCLHRASVDEFARLLEMIRRTHREHWGTAGDLFVPLQLTHSGRHSVPRPAIAYHNPYIDQKTGIPPDLPPITDPELAEIEDRYVDAARLAVQAGFDAVDMKVTHGYLAAELMGAKTREGCYGGPLENRTRFARNIIGKIRAAVGARLTICMRLGCFDGVPYFRDPQTGIGLPARYTLPYPYGFGVDPRDPQREDLTEVKQAIAWFRESGVERPSARGCQARVDRRGQERVGEPEARSIGLDDALVERLGEACLRIRADDRFHDVGRRLGHSRDDTDDLPCLRPEAGEALAEQALERRGDRERVARRECPAAALERN